MELNQQRQVQNLLCYRYTITLYTWPLLSSSGAVFLSPSAGARQGERKETSAKARPLFLYPPQGQAALSVMLLSLVYLSAAFCASRASFGPNSAMFPRSYCGRSPAALLNASYSSFRRRYRTAFVVYSSSSPRPLAAISSRLTLRSDASTCLCFCVAS